MALPRLLILFGAGAIPIALSGVAHAQEIARFDTVMGSFDVELFESAPITVANFRSYVSSGRYNDTFVHRAAAGFVVQGGGYFYDDAAQGPEHIAVDAPIPNEFSFERSNIRGTIGMAKLAGDPDSATSEFFFNLADNSANLDYQNGGFTVFGRVLCDGMDVIDAIDALDKVNAGGAFSDLPVRNWSGGGQVLEKHLVVIHSISLLTSPCAADINRDGFLDGIDADLFNNRFETGDICADFNGDGFVDGIDSDEFNNAFEAGC